MNADLKAMVEAMGAELRDQSNEASETGAGSEWRLDGYFDLEKLARAGLAAVEPILSAKWDAEAAAQQRMDDACAAEWEGVERQ